jgi:hypothetical protein
MFQPYFFSLKKSLFGCTMLLLTMTAQAQVADTTALKTKHKMHASLGIQAGSNALGGVDFAINVTKFLNIRVGYNYLAASKPNYQPDLSSFGLDFKEIKDVVNLSTKVNFSNANLIAEFLPTKKQRLRLAVGLGYVLGSTNLEGKVTTSASVRKDGFEITPSDIGSLSITATPKSKILPYLGIGFGRVIPKKRVSLSVDLGTYYMNSLQFKVNGTEMLSDNSQNGEILTRNLAPYKWYPVGNIRLGVRLF